MMLCFEVSCSSFFIFVRDSSFDSSAIVKCLFRFVFRMDIFPREWFLVFEDYDLVKVRKAFFCT